MKDREEKSMGLAIYQVDAFRQTGGQEPVCLK
jgi:hypothetical protein